MPISMAFIMAIVGVMIVMMISIMFYSQIEGTITCPTGGEMAESCERTKSTAWTVIGILPIAMFFIIFRMFGGLTESSDSDDREYSGDNDSKPRRKGQKIPLHIQILLMLRLAKLKNSK